MTDPVASRPRRRWWLILLGVVAVPLVLIVLYVGLAFRWSYSDGERAGVLQKFSRRGWICKTYEGELAMSVVPGVAPTIWDFTVRDVQAVPALNRAIGRRVVLHYTEHPGIPTSCFGHTAYYVDSVSIVP